MAAGGVNLLPNGGLENGFATGIGSSGSFSLSTSPAWGPITQTTATGTQVFRFALVAVTAGQTYTLSCDPVLVGGASTGYVDMLGYNASGAQVWDSSQVQLTGPFDFDTTTGRRGQIANTQTIPSGVVTVACRFVCSVVSGSTCGFRQMKLEAGSAWSSYSSEATISQSFSAINTTAGALASLSSTVSTQGVSITSLQSASSTQGGQIATLTTNLSTTNANVSANASAITAANQSIATLSQTVSSQGATITQQASAISTLQGQTATLTQQVTAGKQNLLSNGDFSNGLTDWTSGGAGGWTVSAEWSGRRCTTSASGVPTLLSPRFKVQPGQAITAGVLSQDSRSANGMYLQLRYEDESGGNLSYGAVVLLSKNTPARTWVTDTPPANAIYGRLWFAATGDSSGYVELNNCTVVTGSVDIPNATPTASVTQTFQALSTLNSQYASLTSTVSTQGVTITQQAQAITTLNGSVSTLFGRAAVTVNVNGVVTGWETNNNGSTGDFKISADKFSIVPTSSSGARTEFSSGNWRIYDSGGTLRVQLGVY